MNLLVQSILSNLELDCNKITIQINCRNIYIHLHVQLPVIIVHTCTDLPMCCSIWFNIMFGNISVMLKVHCDTSVFQLENEEGRVPGRALWAGRAHFRALLAMEGTF